MDHASAHIMPLTSEAIASETLSAGAGHEGLDQGIGKSEHTMHNKEQNKHKAFYHDLGNIIKNYDHVLLFGPTDAKSELLNLLKEDQHFQNIQIDVVPADHMTEHQEHAFVKQHFAKN